MIWCGRLMIAIMQPLPWNEEDIILLVLSVLRERVESVLYF